uniref:Uncharacterized protein n=1 Tax=viral metagenome TaxID=1070528 RepID=A0A6M3KMK9_9ZZZZ
MVDKLDKPTQEQQAVIDEIAEWIDGKVLAESLAEELVDNGIEVTLENMRLVWHNMLELLHDNIWQAMEMARNAGWRL